MSKIQEMHYKETTPLSTVDKLKGILSSMGIECEEEWQRDCPKNKKTRRRKCR